MNRSDLAEFAAELRELRLSTGLSCRALAGRAHFSRTTVSNVENGVRIPSLDIVQAFVRACDGDLGAAEEKWRRLRRTEDLVVGIPPVPGAAASPWESQPVADGADPDQAGCSADAITVSARRIALNGQRRILGQVKLRFSRSRKAAWGRFRGFGTLDRMADRHCRVDVAVEVVRESDGRRARYQDEYWLDYLWGGLLLVDSGPVFARAEVIADGNVVGENSTERRVLLGDAARRPRSPADRRR
jgi:transcriptional regulator with XRE-family HTH domain